VSSCLCVSIILKKIETQRHEDTKKKFSFFSKNGSHCSQISSVISPPQWLIVQQGRLALQTQFYLNFESEIALDSAS